MFSTAFSPDRKGVVATDNAGRLVRWQANTGVVQWSGKIEAVAHPRVDEVTGEQIQFTLSGATCTFTPDGRYLFVGGADYVVRLFDSTTGEQLHRFESHQDIVWAVAATRTKEGRLLGLSGGGDRQALRVGGQVPGAHDYAIRLWDLDSRKEIRRFVGHEGSVQSLTFCPNGRHILSAGSDKTVRLWDVASGKLLRTYRGHTEFIRSVAVSPDGRTAVSGGDDCVLRYWCLPASVADLALALDKKDCARVSELLADLDAMQPDLHRLFPKLMQVMRRNKEDLTPFALVILRHVGQPDKAWSNDLRELLLHPQLDARRFAADALARLGKDALPALAGLRKALQDSDRAVRLSAATALVNLGPDAHSAVADLERLIAREKDSEVQMAAVHALGKIDASNQTVRRRLREALAGDDDPARLAALKNLLDVGPEAGDLEPCLRALPDPASQELARAVLMKVPLHKKDVPRLIEALEDNRVEMRAMAATLLGRMGADAADAKPALMKRLRENAESVCLASALAVAALAPSNQETAEILPILIQPLKIVKKPSPLKANKHPGPNPLAGGFDPDEGGVMPPDFQPPQADAQPENKGPTKKEEIKAAKAREAIARIGLSAAPALFETLNASRGPSDKAVGTRYQIYLTFTALGSKAATVRNRQTLFLWVRREWASAAGNKDDENYQAALTALESMGDKGQIPSGIKTETPPPPEKADTEAKAETLEADAARKLKFAKELHRDALQAESQGKYRESERLMREHRDSLREIINEFPRSKAAVEAKKLLED